MSQPKKQPTEFLIVYINEAGKQQHQSVGKAESDAWLANHGAKLQHLVIVGELVDVIASNEYRLRSESAQQPVTKKAGRPKGSKSKPKVPGAGDLLSGNKNGKDEKEDRFHDEQG